MCGCDMLCEGDVWVRQVVWRWCVCVTSCVKMMCGCDMLCEGDVWVWHVVWRWCVGVTSRVKMMCGCDMLCEGDVWVWHVVWRWCVGVTCCVKVMCGCDMYEGDVWVWHVWRWCVGVTCCVKVMCPCDKLCEDDVWVWQVVWRWCVHVTSCVKAMCGCDMLCEGDVWVWHVVWRWCVGVTCVKVMCGCEGDVWVWHVWRWCVGVTCVKVMCGCDRLCEGDVWVWQVVWRWCVGVGASNLSSSGCSHFGLLFSNEDLFATFAILVRDVTDTDGWAQNGSTHSHVFTSFESQFWTNRARNQVQTFYFLLSVPFLLIVAMMFLSHFGSILTAPWEFVLEGSTACSLECTCLLHVWKWVRLMCECDMRSVMLCLTMIRWQW